MTMTGATEQCAECPPSIVGRHLSTRGAEPAVFLSAVAKKFDTLKFLLYTLWFVRGSSSRQ